MAAVGAELHSGVRPGSDVDGARLAEECRDRDGVALREVAVDRASAESGLTDGAPPRAVAWARTVGGTGRRKNPRPALVGSRRGNPSSHSYNRAHGPVRRARTRLQGHRSRQHPAGCRFGHDPTPVACLGPRPGGLKRPVWRRGAIEATEDRNRAEGARQAPLDRSGPAEGQIPTSKNSERRRGPRGGCYLPGRKLSHLPETCPGDRHRFGQ